MSGGRARRGLLQSVGDPAAGQVVGRQLDPDAVAGQDPDEVHPELAADVGQDAVAVLKLDGEHRVRERLDDRPFHFDRISLGHGVGVPFLTMSAGPGGPTHERVAYQNGPDRANRRSGPSSDASSGSRGRCR